MVLLMCSSGGQTLEPENIIWKDQKIAKENGTPEAHLEESRGGKEDYNLFCKEEEEYVDVFFAVDHPKKFRQLFM